MRNTSHKYGCQKNQFITIKKGGKDNGDVKEDQPKICKASSPGVSPSDVERVDQVTTDAKEIKVVPDEIDDIINVEYQYTAASDYASIILEIGTDIERQGTGTFRAPPFIQNDKESIINLVCVCASIRSSVRLDVIFENKS